MTLLGQILSRKMLKPKKVNFTSTQGTKTQTQKQKQKQSRHAPWIATNWKPIPQAASTSLF